MQRKTIFFLLVLAFLAVSLVMAGGHKTKKLTGKVLYKTKCRVCHGPNARAGEFTPMSLIQEQWERFFKEKFVSTHKDVKDPKHDNKPVTEVFTKEELKKIEKFLVNHAADSEQPETCG